MKPDGTWDIRRAGGLNGRYFPSFKTIYIHSRAHVKTVVHEFYHHLDDGSRGRTTSVSLTWRFADLWWDALVHP